MPEITHDYHDIKASVFVGQVSRNQPSKDRGSIQDGQEVGREICGHPTGLRLQDDEVERQKEAEKEKERSPNNERIRRFCERLDELKQNKRLRMRRES